jgi:hypothetical protein
MQCISQSSLEDHGKNKKDGIEAKQPGPLPILLMEIEGDLKAWIIGMQCQGVPYLQGCNSFQRK